MKRLAVFGVLLLSAGLLGACGGGGGGGGGSPYTGLRTPAAIVDNNYDNVARQAYEGADLGAGSAVVPLAPDVGSGDPAPLPKTVSLPLTLRSAVQAALSGRISTKAPGPKAVQTGGDTVYDGLGGSMDFTLSIEDTTGDFWGTFTFNGWHGEGGVVISGPVNVSGHFDLSAYPAIRLTSLSMSFGSVSGTDGPVSVRIAGTIAMTFAGAVATVTENLFLTDTGTGKTVWIDDYSLTLTEGSGSGSVTISGRIYLPDFGYVDVATTTPFVYPAGGSYPSAGVLMVYGSNGAKVRLTATSASGCTIELDRAPGDDVYDVFVTVIWI